MRPTGAENSRAEQQFMAGWIALRYLRRSGAANDAFQARGRRQRAIRSCWRGRPLAGARRRGAQADAGGAGALPGGGALSDRLLRPVGPREGRARRTTLPAPAVSRAERAKAARLDVVRARNCSMPSTRATSPIPSWLTSATKSEDTAASLVLSEIGPPIPGRPRHDAARQAALARGYTLTTPRSRHRRPHHSRSARRSSRPSSIHRPPGKLVNPRTISSANGLA